MNSFFTALTFLFFSIISSPSLHALEVERVPIRTQTIVGGEKLQLNGAGVRTLTLLFIPIKAYVAAFYTPTPHRTEAAVHSSPGPMQFDFTFLREVDQSDVTKAWRSQFAQSVSYTYPGYEKDRDAFVALFGTLKNGAVETVQLVGNETVVIDSGVRKGVISGRNFQHAFLSLWFGSNPVASDLKSNLLGIR